jgi:hypothetical protein
MLARSVVSPILVNDALTRGLGDAEARVLVEWLIEQAECLAGSLDGDAAARVVAGLCRRGRAIARFVVLWCHHEAHAAALQLAGAERFAWPLPTGTADPCELMQTILDWEEQQRRGASG